MAIKHAPGRWLVPGKACPVEKALSLELEVLKKLLPVFLCFLVLSGTSSRAEVLPDYFGLEAPGTVPVRFTPWVFNDLGDEAPTNPEFSPDFQHFFFTLVDTFENGDMRQTIMYSQWLAGKWSKPREADFLKEGGFNMAEPFFNRGGSALYFQSNRPPGEPIWNVKVFTSQLVDGVFSSPEHVVVADQDQGVFFPFPARDGSLYFTTSLPDRLGRTDLYRAVKDSAGHYTKVSNLGSPLNTEYIEWDPYLDPAEKMMLFVSDRPGGFGLVDVYLSRLTEDGRWGDPVNLGEPINSPLYDTAAKLSPEGRFLFFQRIIDEKEIIFWVDFEEYLATYGK